MDDERLKEQFARLREADRRAAPDFHAMWSKPSPKRSRWLGVVPAMGLAAAAALFAVWCGSRFTAPQTSPARTAIVVHEAPEPGPLDFLLETPARAAIVTVPDFDHPPVMEPKR
jgi:hypothetical protein